MAKSLQFYLKIIKKYTTSYYRNSNKTDWKDLKKRIEKDLSNVKLQTVTVEDIESVNNSITKISQDALKNTVPREKVFAMLRDSFLTSYPP